MAIETFYQPITDLVSLDTIPDELGFVKNGVTNLLDKLLYKDLQYSRTRSGDTAFYNLSLISKTRMAVEIPGTGIDLILNPEYVESSGVESVFPLSVQYNWPIIGYLGSLDLSGVSFNAASLFGLAQRIIRLPERALIERAMAAFLTEVPNPLNVFVAEVNEMYNTTIPIPASADPIGELLTALKNEPKTKDVGVTMFTLFILDNVDPSKTKDNLIKFFSGLVQPDIETYLLNLLKPQFDASITLGAGLEFPRNILLPVDDNGAPKPEPNKVMLTFGSAEFFFSTTRGIGYDTALTVTMNHKAQIGQTGLGIELSSAKLDLSRNTNIPEADQDGRSPEFIGAYIQEAAITLPNFLQPDNANSTARLVGRNMIIGTGGFSGTVGLEAKTGGTASPIIKAGLGGGFGISLDNFFVTFRQNTILSSAITGTLKIPEFKDAAGNDAELKIKVELTEGGNYNITLAEEQGIRAIRIPDVLQLTIAALTLGRRENKFFIAITGKLDFTADVPGLGDILPKAIDIKKLIIWQDGSIEFEGGGLTLPKAVTLHAGPVKFSVTALHFGTYKQLLGGVERTYRYFGFDGGISIKPGGVDARGDGIKYYYTSDGLSPFDSFLRIDGIGINLTIPANAKPETAAVILKGYLSMKNPKAPEPAPTEYTGAVTLTLPKVNVAGTAAMKLNPDLPAFLVDLELQISVPIMLGATGLGIYGFRGVVGQKFMPSKTAAEIPETDSWWNYYKSKKPDPPGKEGIHTGKLAQQDGFSVGAGVSLATISDSGKTFSSKLFFMLGLPEVFLLQGQAAILKKRIALDDTVDPPFSALIVITGQSIEAAFGVDYKVPDSGSHKGDILTLQATLEMAFFFNNASGWFINLGKDTPEDKRVRAKVLRLFDGFAFLMLSSSGIKAGAGVSWSTKRSFGPVKIELGVFLELGGQVSFNPVQMGGFIQLGGTAKVKVYRFTLSFEVAAGLSAEAPKPFIITGAFKLKFKIKIFWYLKISFSKTIELTWKFDTAVDKTPLPVIGATTANYTPAIASNIMSRDVYPIKYTSAATNTIPVPNNEPVIPMDCYIDVEFLQAVRPGPDPSLDRIGYSRSAIAMDYQLIVPPEKAVSEQVQHEFTVETISIKLRHDNQWKDYFVYEAVSTIQSLASLPGVTVEDHTGAEVTVTDLKSLNAGYWQIQRPNRFDKLRILSQNMFSYQTDGAPGGISVDGQEFGSAAIFCAPALNETCVNWRSPELVNTVYPSTATHSFNGLHCRSVQNMSVPAVTPVSLQGLRITDELEIRFEEPMAKIVMNLITDISKVVILYCNQRWEMDEDGNITGIDEMIETRIIQVAQLNQPIIYENLVQPVNKIIVKAGIGNMLNTVPLKLGGEAPRLGGSFTGWMDEVWLYNEVLTETDIRKVKVGNNLFPSLVAGWNLDQSTADVTGNHPGEIVQAVNWAPGVQNSGIELNSRSYIRVPHHPALNFFDDDFTLTAWIKLNLDGHFRECAIIQKMQDTTNALFGYCLFSHNGRLILDLATGTAERFQSNAILVSNKWQHVAVTVNRTIRLVKMYVDGILVNEFPLNGQLNPGSLVMQDVCYTTYREAKEYAGQAPHINIEEEVTQMENGITKRFQPIWRPNTTFAIQILTNDKVTHNGTETNNRIYHNLTFQTKSTLGHFHKQDPRYGSLPDSRKEEYKLSKLQHYIDYEGSYPNADGKLVNAKPLFFTEVELLLFFRHPYIYSMFSNWEAYQGLGREESALEVLIRDAEGQEILQAPVYNLQTQEGGWGEDIIKINHFVENGQNCTSTQSIKPFAMQTLFKMPDLKPEKLYTAIFNSLYKAAGATATEKSEVHKYVFQTSRYSNFEEQVKSCLLFPGKAIFTMEVDIPVSALDKAREILLKQLSDTDPLTSQFADPYDRLIQGALQLSAMNVPVSTEFTLIRHKGNGQLLGILIRNPEPFNDPKLPDTQKQSMIVAGLSTDPIDGPALPGGEEQSMITAIPSVPVGSTPLLTLVAKEPSRIFISNDIMNLLPGELQLTFRYFLFNGKIFAEKDAQEIMLSI